MKIIAADCELSHASQHRVLIHYIRTFAGEFVFYLGEENPAMRHLSWGLTMFGAIGALGLGAILAQADSFAGRADFGPANAFERKAAWGQGDAGACRILNPTINIRKD